MFRDDPLSALLFDSGYQGYQALPGKEWHVPLQVDLDGERLVWSEEAGRLVVLRRGPCKVSWKDFSGCITLQRRRF